MGSPNASMIRPTIGLTDPHLVTGLATTCTAKQQRQPRRTRTLISNADKPLRRPKDLRSGLRNTEARTPLLNDDTLSTNRLSVHDELYQIVARCDTGGTDLAGGHTTDRIRLVRMYHLAIGSNEVHCDGWYI